MIAEAIILALLILGFIFLHTRLYGSKFYNYVTILILPFIMSYLFIHTSEYKTSTNIFFAFFLAGFIYQAVKFYSKYLNPKTSTDD